MIRTKRSYVAYFLFGWGAVMLSLGSYFAITTIQKDLDGGYLGYSAFVDVLGLACFWGLFHMAAGLYREYQLDADAITVHSLFGRKKRFMWEEYPYAYIIELRTMDRGHLRQMFILFSKKPLPACLKKGRDDANTYYVMYPKKYIIFEHTDEIEQKIHEMRPEIVFENRRDSLQYKKTC